MAKEKDFGGEEILSEEFLEALLRPFNDDRSEWQQDYEGKSINQRRAELASKLYAEGFNVPKV